MPDGFRLQTRLFVARDLATTFGFFADAGNLQQLTPPWLDFAILTTPPVAMRVGALIDYRIRLHGIPLTWRTEIARWEPPHRFVDRQLRGPYRLWHHTHSFTATDGGTLVDDTVRYRPLGGALVHALFVRGDLERIFLFRQAAILRVFGVPAREPLRVTFDRIQL